MFRSLLIALSLILLTIGGSGCSGSRIHQARAVLHEADSLRAAGVPYNDSLLLGETVDAFAPWHYLYPTDYARACYFYGRCLRAAGHQPQAMQSFINAIHAYDFPASLFTRQPDHAILGCVYSNMANMCRLEGNHDLAYLIYEQSADHFIKLIDSIPYYYALNNCAVQRAEQSDKETTTRILSNIEQLCSDECVLVKILETKAIMHYHVQEYDSVLMYVNKLQSCGYSEPVVFVLKAQSYWQLEQMDSALYYAKQVLSCPCSINDSVNMLYILSHNDPNIDGDSILTLTSIRADKQFAYTRQQETLAHAVEILQQDIDADPNHLSLIAWISLLLIGCIGSMAVMVLHRHGKLLSFRRQHIMEENMSLLKQTNQIQLQREQQLSADIALLQQSNNSLQEMQWNDYNQLCLYINRHFFMLANKLSCTHALNEKEIRLCILVFLGYYTDKQMADILCYSDKSIRAIKRNTALKLGTTSANLHRFLVEMVLNIPS